MTDLRLQSNVVWSQAVWVCACRFHHGQFDDARKIRPPREAIPEETEAYAAILGLTWWLDQRYGRRDGASSGVDPVS